MVLVQQKQSRQGAREHADGVGVVQPAVMRVGIHQQQDVPKEPAEQETARLDSARRLVLLLWHHFGNERLRRDVIQGLAQAPEQDAREEAQEEPILRGEHADVDTERCQRDAEAHEKPAADAMREGHGVVANSAEDGVQQDRRAIDELREAHEDRLLFRPQLLALHREQVRQPSGTEKPSVESVGRQADDGHDGPTLWHTRARGHLGAIEVGGLRTVGALRRLTLRRACGGSLLLREGRLRLLLLALDVFVGEQHHEPVHIFQAPDKKGDTGAEDENAQHLVKAQGSQVLGDFFARGGERVGARAQQCKALVPHACVAPTLNGHPRPEGQDVVSARRGPGEPPACAVANVEPVLR
mmetsp:Transcript_97023/g.278799  ORF Transcript_97023/g.278799 Transcript_97023/m.278799 type:complete len:355 (+) Transcript_97023:964-2028(+)